MARNAFLVVAAIVAVVTGAVLAAPQDKQPAGTKMAVVDLKRCFDKQKYEYVKDVDTQLEKFKADLDAEDAASAKKMGDLVEQMKGIPDKSSQLYLEKAKDYKMAELKRELDQRINKARFMDKYTDLKTKVYNEIRGVVTIVAQQEGIDIVMRIEEPQLDEDNANLETVSQRINHRVVLYGSDRLDITTKVIERLNQEYQKKKAGGVKVCPKCKKENPAAAEKCSCGEALPK